MHLSKRITVGIGLAVVPLILAACGNSSTGASKQEFSTSSSDQLTSVDLSKSTALATFNTLNNVGEGLVRLGANSKVEPGIAKTNSVSKDGLTYTFNLRKNAKWSNGDPVTAQDFVYSWQRTVNPKTASQYTYLFSGIKNADSIVNKKKPVSSLGIKADGKYKLTVTLEKRIPYFKLLMGFPVFFPQNEKVVNKYGSKYGTTAKAQVYNGPFTLTNWNGSSMKYTLKRNKSYWDKSDVKMQQINVQVIKEQSTGLNLYNQKKLDMDQLSTTQAKQMKNDKNLVNRRQSSSYYIAFNQKNKMFKNEKMRQAMSMIIDRDELVSKVVGGGAVNPKSFVSQGLAKSPADGTDFTKDTEVPAAMKHNVAQAKKLWNEGLKESGQTEVSFTLLNSDGYDMQQLSQYLQSELQQLPHLKVSLSNIPGRTLLSRQADHDFEASVCNWFADFSDPITFLNITTSGNGSNNAQWSNKTYDKLIDASNNADANDATKRWNDMVKAQNILLKEQGITPLYQSGEAWLVRPYVKGIVYNTAGANYDYKSAYIDK